MKAFLRKYLYIIAILGGIALALPFVQIISDASVDEARADGYSHISYDRLSGLDILWERAITFFDQGTYLPEQLVIVLLILLFFMNIAQIVSAIRRQNKIVLYTAIVLFSALFTFMVFIIRNTFQVNITYGYYAYLIIQAIIIWVTPSSTKIKNKHDIAA